jgi:hypothetical protein
MTDPVLLRVIFPTGNAAFQGGIVERWHFNIGDVIGFGDPLCDISIDQFLSLQRTKRASLLGSTSRRRQNRVTDGIDYRDGRGAVLSRLRCAESGMVFKQRAADVGDRVSVGSTIALIGSPDSDSGSAPLEAEARVTLEIPEPEDLGY